MIDDKIDILEEWKPVPLVKYSDYYEVSSFGNVRRICKQRNPHLLKRMKSSSDKKMYVSLSVNEERKNILVEALVAITFLNARKDFCFQVQHIDGNIDNCKMSNLNICDVTQKPLYVNSERYLSSIPFEDEVWKLVPGYDFVLVSNKGRVAEIKKGNTIIKKQQLTYNGYLIVKIKINDVNHSLRVHRAVASAFIPNPNNYPQVNHLDENKMNNKLENLEWCTSKYNNNYGTKKARISASMKRRYSKINKNERI